MKKYLLTALLGVFALVGFTDAKSYSFTKVSDNNILMTPSFTISVNQSIDFSKTEFTSVDGFDGCSWAIYNSESSQICDNYCDEEGCASYGETCELTPGTYRVEASEGYTCQTLTFYTDYEENDVGQSGGSGLPILTGGTNMFSGIITSLGSAISEFIPYIVYVGLGLLGAIISFVAIKRLINRVRAKIYGTFSGGRRR